MPEVSHDLSLSPSPEQPPAEILVGSTPSSARCRIDWLYCSPLGFARGMTSRRGCRLRPPVSSMSSGRSAALGHLVDGVQLVVTRFGSSDSTSQSILHLELAIRSVHGHGPHVSGELRGPAQPTCGQKVAMLPPLSDPFHASKRPGRSARSSICPTPRAGYLLVRRHLRVRRSILADLIRDSKSPSIAPELVRAFDREARRRPERVVSIAASPRPEPTGDLHPLLSILVPWPLRLSGTTTTRRRPATLRRLEVSVISLARFVRSTSRLYGVRRVVADSIFGAATPARARA